jgi:hypothetical protein
VIRRVARRGGNYPSPYEVEYRNGVKLLVPIAVTEPYVIGPNQSKLSIEALRELVVAAECLERDEHSPQDLWTALPPALRRQIVDDVAAVLAEISREVRTGEADPSGAQGCGLHPTIAPPVNATGHRNAPRSRSGRRRRFGLGRLNEISRGKRPEQSGYLNKEIAQYRGRGCLEFRHSHQRRGSAP